MKNSLFFLAAFLVATPAARADIHHSIAKSVKLSVDAAASTTTRLGSSYRYQEIMFLLSLMPNSAD